MSAKVADSRPATRPAEGRPRLACPGTLYRTIRSLVPLLAEQRSESAGGELAVSKDEMRGSGWPNRQDGDSMRGFVPAQGVADDT